MAIVLHGNARTREFEPNSRRRKRRPAPWPALRLSRTAVAKWRARTTTSDAPMGPRDSRSTVLTPVEEAMIVESWRRTPLPLDDVMMGCLRVAIPKLTRSSLHRCLARHGISRLPKSEDQPAGRGRFAETRIGYVHVDHCELRNADGKLHMFLAIDRVSKFTVVDFYDRAKMTNATAFLRDVIAALPYRLHAQHRVVSHHAGMSAEARSRQTSAALIP